MRIALHLEDEKLARRYMYHAMDIFGEDLDPVSTVLSFSGVPQRFKEDLVRLLRPLLPSPRTLSNLGG